MIFQKSSKILLYIVAFVVMSLTNNTAYAVVVDRVIVVVNDEVVTQREFDKTYYPIKEQHESRFKGEELERRLKEVKEAVLEQLINSKLVVSLAKKKKIEIDENELRNRIDKIKEYYGSQEAFLQALNAKGTNLTEFEQEIREQMLAQKLVDQEVASKIVVTPAEVRDLYKKNKEKFVAPNRVKVRSIMIRKTDDETLDQAHKRIEEIVADLKKGKDFAALAAKRSEGPYRDNGGDMGYIVPGQMLEEIDKVIFSLKKQELSDIVQTHVGFHVFLVEDIEKSRLLEINEVSDFLRQQLYMKRFEENMINWLEAKRKNAYIAYK